MYAKEQKSVMNCAAVKTAGPCCPIRLPEKKKGTSYLIDCLSLSAEREGFEPPEAFTSTVFKTAAFDRSAISPAQK